MLLVNSLYAFEKFRIKADIVSVLGENWTHFLCQCVHFVVCFCTKHIEKRTFYTWKKVVIMLASFHFIFTDKCIFESRFFSVVYCFLYLLVLTAYSFQHSLFVIGKRYFVEWNSFVWCIVWLKEGIQALLSLLVCIFCHVLLSLICYKVTEKTMYKQKSITHLTQFF